MTCIYYNAARVVILVHACFINQLCACTIGIVHACIVDVIRVRAIDIAHDLITIMLYVDLAILVCASLTTIARVYKVCQGNNVILCSTCKCYCHITCVYCR